MQKGGSRQNGEMDQTWPNGRLNHWLVSVDVLDWNWSDYYS